uniref:MICOS complex subunit MIC60 n=1 Tax=Mola mola TaxID=94237 RepID=A0A3Q3W9C1_MOLML
MLRACLRGADAAARVRRPSHLYHVNISVSGAAKVVTASLLTLGGGIGGTILYAKWDHKFRAAVEKNVPYSDRVFGLALGPASQDVGIPVKKQVSMDSQKVLMMWFTNVVICSNSCNFSNLLCFVFVSHSEASTEATHIISAISEVQSVPAPCDTKAATAKAVSVSLEDSLASSAKATLQAIGAQEAALQAITQHSQKLKTAMEVAPQEKSTQWKDVEAALSDRTCAVNDAGTALLKANEALASLKTVINKSKELKIAAVRPLVLAAEENLHNMVVDLDKVITQVQTAESEAKIVSQYSELVREAKQQFEREVSSLTPEIQANWKGLTGKLSVDDLNALIAHAHRRIDQLNRELAEQRVREQIHIDAALEQQKMEHQNTQEKAINTALQHITEDARLERERKLSELREVMEAEMRTQLRRQAAAHTDHVRDVIKVQEQELRAEAEQVLSSKTLEMETRYRQLSQEQLDNFTLDMNTAYARLKGMEEAIDSHVVAEEEARKAHQLWLSVDALNYTIKTADAESPCLPLESVAQVVKDSCHNNDFALALSSALPEESLHRGVYSEASLRARFNSLRPLARRVALIDESHNSLYQYLLSYLQAALLFEEKQQAPPAQLSSEDLDPFRLLSYANYCLEHGDLELAAKLVNQLRGEARRVVEDWLTEARLTLETRQVVSLLSTLDWCRICMRAV